jgi:hypothetical protein
MMSKSCKSIFVRAHSSLNKPGGNGGVGLGGVGLHLEVCRYSISKGKVSHD